MATATAPPAIPTIPGSLGWYQVVRHMSSSHGRSGCCGSARPRTVETINYMTATSPEIAHEEAVKWCHAAAPHLSAMRESKCVIMPVALCELPVHRIRDP